MKTRSKWHCPNLAGENTQKMCLYLTFKSSNLKHNELLLYNFEHILLLIAFTKMCAPFLRNQIVFAILNFIYISIYIYIYIYIYTHIYIYIYSEI